MKDLYADSLVYVDALISRLFDHLQKTGLWDKTLIVLTGDHGQAVYEHGFAAHGSALFDEVLRVPLLIRAPGLSASQDPRLAQQINVPPSVVDLLGLPTHRASRARVSCAPVERRSNSFSWSRKLR